MVHFLAQNFSLRLLVKRLINTAIFVIVAILFASCGRRHSPSMINTTDSNDPRSILSAEGIKVQVFDEYGAPDLTAQTTHRLQVEQNGFNRQVKVELTNPTPIRTNFLLVTFDDTREHPTDIKIGEAFDNLHPLTYSGSPKNGKVIIAQVLIGNNKPIVSGTLLQLELASGAQSVRSISKINQDPSVSPIITSAYFDKQETNKLYWTFKLRGDGNQNQVFDFGDFGVISSRFQQKVSDNPGCEPADGSNNGQIDFPDFGVVGANYGKGIGAMVLYRGVDQNSLEKIGVLEINGKVKGDYKFDQTSFTSNSSNGFKQQSFIFPSKGSGCLVKLELLDESGEPMPGYGAFAKLPFGTGKQGDWWMFGHDPQHTRLSEYVGSPYSVIKWKFKTNGNIYSSPALGADGTIYIGSDDKNLHAINPDGSQKWAYSIGDYV